MTNQLDDDVKALRELLDGWDKWGQEPVYKNHAQLTRVLDALEKRTKALEEIEELIEFLERQELAQEPYVLLVQKYKSLSHIVREALSEEK